MYANGVTKEKVIAELKRLQSEGHSMKISDFENWLKYEISKHFGGYKNAKSELSISVRTRKSKARRSADDSKRKYSDHDLAKLLADACEAVNYRSEIYANYPKVTAAIIRRCANLESFAEQHGVKLPPKKGSYAFTDEEIANEIRLLETSGKKLTSNSLRTSGYRSLVESVKRRYGSWNKGLREMGIDVLYETPTLHKTPEQMVEEVRSALSRGVKPTHDDLSKEIRGFSRWLRKLFGSLEELKKQVGICSITHKPKKDVSEPGRTYHANLSVTEGFKREILRLYYVGCPLNYTAIKKRRGHLLEAANTLYGSWRKALEKCGFNYEDISVNGNTLAECGTDFERVLGDLLKESGVDFEKYSHAKLNPDFVLSDGRWIDAKLSEWTDASETIKRYLPECESLMIVYLRGAKTERLRGRKYRHKTISAYLLADKLPDDRRNYYYEKFTEIENIANAGEIGSHLA